jgi:hypothetical protein
MNLRAIDFKPHGVLVYQSWEQVGLYLRAIDKYNVDLFVEVGIGNAGLTQFIIPRTWQVPEFHYVGIEKNVQYLGPLSVMPLCKKASVFIGDCFSPQIVPLLRKAIGGSKRMFLLCDGGNKPKELRYFKDFLREGDLIATHDFTDEVTEEDLDCLKSGWNEVEPELYRAALIPLFRRSSPR